MSDLRAAAQQALEALHSVEWHGGSSAWMLNDCKVEGAIHALRTALAEPSRSQRMRDAGFTRRPKGWVKDGDEPEGGGNLPPPLPVAWTPVAQALPKSGVIVLACYRNRLGNLRRIRAKWIAAKTQEGSGEYDFGEYDEEADCYWTPEGWYECIDNWDEYTSVAVCEGDVTHWMPLPPDPDTITSR